MKRARWFAASVLAVLAVAGLAAATPAPVPAADPIGDVIPQQPSAQPPAQTQTPSAQPSSPITDLVTETPAMQASATSATPATGTDEMPTGTPLPELADPLSRPRQGIAIVQALDKVTAETIRFAVPVGQQRRWRGLVFRARACETTAADEPMRDSMAYLEIYSQPRARDGAVDPRRIFQGWMFASSPGLSAMQHPLYDAWVIACQAEAPSEA